MAEPQINRVSNELDAAKSIKSIKNDPDTDCKIILIHKVL